MIVIWYFLCAFFSFLLFIHNNINNVFVCVDWLQLERHAKGLMLSGVGLASAFDWDSERINYESVRKNFDELELVERLRLETIHCDTCGHRLIIDCRMDGITYCTCNASNTTASKAAKLASKSFGKSPEAYEKQWLPYMERQNMIIWRREEKPGLFAYKGE